MPVERAVHAYRHERLNCAQSIFRAFQASGKVDEEQIAAARAHGHGRAEAGLCGALHAALQLACDPAQRDRVRASFVAEAGSDQCREIRRSGRVPCVDCVRLAARLIAGDRTEELPHG